MRENKSTHFLEDKGVKGGVSAMNANEGGQKYTLPKDEETKVGGCDEYTQGRMKSHTS